MAGQTYGGGDATTQYTETAMDGGFASRAVSNGNEDTILLRRDHEDAWETANPVLGAGEIGLVINKTYFKVGDNVSRWSQLPKYDFDVQIEQGTGEREDAVMSQKAVTDAIAEETTRATNAEQTLTANLNTERNNRTTAINSLQSAINTETTNRQKDTTGIKNIMAKSNVSNNEELNDIIKELYISNYPKTDYTLKSISIYRNHTSHGYNIIFLSTDKDGNNVWTNCNFSSKAESYDVSYGTISNQNRVGWCVGAELYALIDWTKIDNGGEKTFSVDDFSFNNHIYKVKFSPQINSCILNHRFSHSAEANNIVKELYFSDVKKNSINVSDYDFKRFFSLERIDRQRQDRNGKDYWSIVFYINNTDTGYHNHLFTNIYSSPEGDDVLKMELEATVGVDLYTATVYIVLDWTAIEQNSDYSLNARLIPGARVKVNYPIICNYIENETLRTQLAELTTQLANKE